MPAFVHHMKPGKEYAVRGFRFRVAGHLEAGRDAIDVQFPGNECWNRIEGVNLTLYLGQAILAEMHTEVMNERMFTFVPANEIRDRRGLLP